VEVAASSTVAQGGARHQRQGKERKRKAKVKVNDADDALMMLDDVDGSEVRSEKIKERTK